MTGSLRRLGDLSEARSFTSVDHATFAIIGELHYSEGI